MPSHSLCEVSASVSVSDQIKITKKLIKIVDILGRKKTNTQLFYIYDNGSVEKKIIFE